MNDSVPHLDLLRSLTWYHALLILAILVGCRLLVQLVRLVVRHAAAAAPSHRRLLILRLAPITRLLIGITGIALIVPLLVKPTFEDIIALLATASLAFAFALKDYVSSLVAGVVTILENTYQPGDWIEMDGTYGEVKTIGTRAVHIVTADDTEVIIPHARFWTTPISNASSGKQSLLCVANFYLHADHDGAAVHQALTDVAEACTYRKAEAPVKVAVTEIPWGTRYKLKVYAAESREQFAMITDLTIRGKHRLRTMGVTFSQMPYAKE